MTAARTLMGLMNKSYTDFFTELEQKQEMWAVTGIGAENDIKVLKRHFVAELATEELKLTQELYQAAEAADNRACPEAKGCAELETIYNHPCPAPKDNLEKLLEEAMEEEDTQAALILEDGGGVGEPEMEPVSATQVDEDQADIAECGEADLGGQPDIAVDVDAEQDDALQAEIAVDVDVGADGEATALECLAAAEVAVHDQHSAMDVDADGLADIAQDGGAELDGQPDIALDGPAEIACDGEADGQAQVAAAGEAEVAAAGEAEIAANGEAELDGEEEPAVEIAADGEAETAGEAPRIKTIGHEFLREDLTFALE